MENAKLIKIARLSIVLLLAGCSSNNNTDPGSNPDPTPEDYSYLTFVLNNDLVSYGVKINPKDTTTTNILIPSTYEGLPVTKIIRHGFDSTKIKSISIPDSITHIESYAFYYAAELTSIKFPANLEYMGFGICGMCDKLSTITLPEGITYVSRCAFSNCKSLNSISIPSTCMSVGDYAFEGCSSLYNVNIPENCSFAPNIFDRCSNIKSTVYEGYKYYSYNNNPYYLLLAPVNASETTVTIHPDTKMILSSLFNVYTTDVHTNAIIPEGVEYLSSQVFSSSYASTVTLPSTLKTAPFLDISKITTYTTYENGKYIGKADNPYWILGEMIDKTKSSFTIHPDCRVIYQNAFASSSVKSLDLTGIERVDGLAFQNSTQLETVTFSNALKTIGAAFDGCTKLTALELPDSVEYYEKQLLKGCTAIKKITIPNKCPTLVDGLTYNTIARLFGLEFNNKMPFSIDLTLNGFETFDTNFIDNANLSSFTVSEGFKYFPRYALGGNQSIKEIVIPVSTKALGNNCFVSTNLKKLFYKGDQDSFNQILKDGDYKSEDAALYYYSEIAPTTEGNYWHYDSNNKPTIW